MGHLLKKEYRDLVRRFDSGQVAVPEPRDPRAWEGWKEILEILFSPAEAELASKLPIMPTALRGLAKHLRMPAEELKPKLDAMADRGVVLDIVNPTNGQTLYLLAPPIVGFFEFSMMRAHDKIPRKRMAEALDAYCHGDDTFAKEVFGGDTVVGRALVNETRIDEAVSSDVLDWERATAILAEAKTFAVALCYCRHKAEHLGKACGTPAETCLSLNAGAEYVIRHNFGRRVERAEALDIMTGARESGLVQVADNVMNKPTYLCNCCGCCCEQLHAINEWDLQAVNPSGFLAQPTPDKCSGCARCARACPITAITMQAHRSDHKRKNELVPAVDAERCIGCGVCAGACNKDSMKMVRRPERPYVPKNSVERAVRMAVERGRLADLMFAEGAGRGSAFLNHFVAAITSLPAAQRVLASEQVKSRFLRAVLSQVKDPTDR